MKQFYTHDGNDQKGPFDINDLLKSGISKVTPVWYEGLSEWTTAGEVEELKDLIKKGSPPPIKNNQVPPPMYNTEKNQIPPLENMKSKNHTRKPILTLVIALVIAIAGYAILEKMNHYGGDPGNSYVEKVMTIEEIERSRPTDFLSVTGTYKENFWGNKFKVECEIINKATVASYKDVIVRVTYYSKTNSALSTYDHPVYEVFSPTSTRKVEFKIDNYKNVSSIGLTVLSAMTY